MLPIESFQHKSSVNPSHYVGSTSRHNRWRLDRPESLPQSETRGIQVYFRCHGTGHDYPLTGSIQERDREAIPTCFQLNERICSSISYLNRRRAVTNITDAIRLQAIVFKSLPAGAHWTGNRIAKRLLTAIRISPGLS